MKTKEMKEEFNLKENRKELKKVLQNTRSDLIKEINYVFGLIEEQDKEFIKRLKEKGFVTCMSNGVKKLIILVEEIDKLSGDLK